MGKNINGGSILARLLLEDKKFHMGIKKGVIAGLAFSKKIGSAFSAMGSKIDAVGGRMVEQAERYTYLAGAIFAPIVLSMKSFADGGKVAAERIKELQEQYSQLKPFEWTKKAQIEQELLRLSQIEMQTRKARFAQNQLVSSFKNLNYSIGRLLWDTLGEYVPRIVQSVKASILWIQANKELASKVVKVVAGFGALMLVLAPTVAIVGKVIRVFAFGFQIISMLLSPVGLLVLALGALYLIFKDQLDPIISDHVEQLKELWNQWRAGEITSKEATSAILKIFGSFFVDLKDLIWSGWTEWITGGWIEDSFAGILISLDKFNAGVKAIWQGIIDTFNWAKDQIKGAMDYLYNVFDQAVGHSWWPKFMGMMSNNSKKFMGETALAFAGGASQIKSSMSVIQSSMSSMNSLRARGIFGMSFDQAQGVLAGAASSNTFNISGGLSTQEFQSQIKRYVENASRQQYRRMLRS